MAGARTANRKADRLELRLEPANRRLLDEAAAASAMSVSAFVLSHANQAARELLADGKREAAMRSANYVNSDEKVGVTWRYLLVSESDVDTTTGSWSALQKLGAADGRNPVGEAVRSKLVKGGADLVRRTLLTGMDRETRRSRPAPRPGRPVRWPTSPPAPSRCGRGSSP